jgi:hypothetical protein
LWRKLSYHDWNDWLQRALGTSHLRLKFQQGKTIILQHRLPGRLAADVYILFYVIPTVAPGCCFTKDSDRGLQGMGFSVLSYGAFLPMLLARRLSQRPIVSRRSRPGRNQRQERVRLSNILRAERISSVGRGIFIPRSITVRPFSLKGDSFEIRCSSAKRIRGGYDLGHTTNSMTLEPREKTVENQLTAIGNSMRCYFVIIGISSPLHEKNGLRRAWSRDHSCGCLDGSTFATTFKLGVVRPCLGSIGYGSSAPLPGLPATPDKEMRPLRTVAQLVI